MEGREGLKQAAEKEWYIGMGNLSSQYRPLFKITLGKLKRKKLAALKSWFVTVRKTREIFEDPSLLHDQFSEKGALRKWIGL